MPYMLYVFCKQHELSPPANYQLLWLSLFVYYPDSLVITMLFNAFEGNRAFTHTHSPYIKALSSTGQDSDSLVLYSSRRCSV